MTRKWNIVNDNSKSTYAAANEITCNTDILKSNLCDYNNANILVKGGITLTAAAQTQVPFKNCAPFTKYIKLWCWRWCWRFRFSQAKVQ